MWDKEVLKLNFLKIRIRSVEYSDPDPPPMPYVLYLEALDDLVVLEHEDILVGHEHLEGVDPVLLPSHLPAVTIELYSIITLKKSRRRFGICIVIPT